MKLEGKVSLITGASRGIGQSIAERFAREGSDLFLSATKVENLDDTKQLVSKYGRKTEVCGLDVSDRESTQAMVEEAIRVFGKIDVLVNNAGIYKVGPFNDIAYDDFDQVMKVNVYGPFNIAQSVLKHMCSRKSGKVINVSSVAGLWARPKQSAYVISKHAMQGMTKSLGQEMAEFNIAVNAICPGMTQTDLLTSSLEEFGKVHGVTPEQAEIMILNQIPMKRWVKPEEIANTALFLASDESGGITGKSLVVDCGMLPF
ncbi:MAG: 3-oxoacyl-ACP reductase FabG [Deltaproteobacteria bacterium]|nr:3-oxoacyl-ACP reductase FabG [Deltaproteobacteria bacterium]MBT4267552.1 3-oxoacyl-ACP reductase FabG [Deltaproteobacteria bacterium]MBT4637188.1 3-oxoacyl-ACP reductase FabG [Deltaproteobacteria bacterium]MBT6500549.1 3-oxoacyl-ACP reductase FabG [Deltaproteobacteria bacterium]MBT7891951.1 3-oxoacyl-ACP reductase FabG [Deltaproteobacteria bacterium]